ncbi:transglycosylase SLT domain-containing protein [Dongia sp.]|uniref:transglycosylase SLT domain-containing protein n=1 Tax=Dongia sp. TaxID=1977262 RepID=UPI00375118A5
MTPALFATQPIRAGGSTIQPDVLASIQKASANTGVDFSYLMAQASRESSFDPAAKASTSSATGLYQFVEQTWLGTFKEHAAEYGYGDLANKITKRADGHFVVADAAARKQILDLRKDPTLNAALAAELASDNKTKMEAALGRPATATDLHLAHFLGLSGALRFIRKMDSDPSTTGAAMFPRAAAANANVFYDESGNARTVAEIYNRMNTSITSDQQTFASLATTPAGGTSPASTTAVASAAEAPLQGFSNPGSILSPLLLVTIAALPLANEQEKEAANAAGHGGGPRHGAIRPTVNPMAALGLG